ncbi:MAG TPA: formyltransferase family protein [Thermomicrobiales bacterium]|jgi:methionyl-tRNA formyltransferase
MPTPPSESWRVILCTDIPFVVPWYKDLLAAAGHRLVGVLTAPTREFGYPDVVRHAQPEADVLVSRRPRGWAAQLAPLRPDLLIANGFPFRLPADLLALPRLGAVNVHPALLPRYRGTDTPFWILRHGEREGGQTLHRMAPDFDTGPILAQARFPLADDDGLDAFIAKMAATLPALWATALPKIAAGDPGEPQDAEQASYYGHIADEAAWKAIDWAQPVRAVHNVVRSAGFARALPPGAVGDIDGVPHRITRTRLLPAMADDSDPGTVVGRDGDMLLVRCGDGAIGVVEYERIAEG